MLIEDCSDEDLPRVLELNQSEVPHVSSLTGEELKALVAEAVYFRKISVDGVLAGFVLGFNDQAHYESSNYQWFLRHSKNFFYIDRVVIDAGHRRMGLGRKLYQDVETFAREREMSSLTCEVNIRPLNIDSLNYHSRLGFQPVGEQDTEGGKKRVSLLSKALGP